MKQILVAIIILFVGNGIAQEKNKNVELVIHTSAECETCKKLLENTLNYTKGIRFAELDVTTKELTVSFSKKKITADEIRTIISKTGYDADQVPALPTAQHALPTCCQPGGMKK